MASLDELIAKLKEIFQTDRADLDFGIYRILNSRSAEINHYLSRELPAQVKAALADKAQEAAVYNHLLTFFARYYDEGDFISQRRYKGNTYAIPYNGEEVMLHWANKDQYYTKSGENFSDYRFTLSDDRRVHFKLVAADTAKDNQKDLNHTRLFVLAEKQEAEYDDEGAEIRPALAPVETAADGQTLTIHFSYQPRPKGEKQDAYLSAAKKSIAAADGVQQDWAELFSRAPTEKQPDRTLLEKHLAAYTTKNSADYFIHKDLGGFLRRELDFYLKNEVMNLDNVQSAADFAPLERDLHLIQTLRTIAHNIIAFLAQLENFQKKLWLKKKFVAASHWLITLNHIPEALLPAVAANEKQLATWKNLFAFKQLPPPLDIFSLVKTDPYLIVDTSLYPPEFQAALLTRLSADLPDGLDAATDGLLIHSDNFQALNLLQARYREQVKCIYIDPPYNTKNDGFIYKDSYQHSSWASFIQTRLQLTYCLLKNSGSIFISIDDNEQSYLKFLCNETFGEQQFIGQICWHRKRGKDNSAPNLSRVHEYILPYAKNISNLNFNRLDMDSETLKAYRNPDNDIRGNYRVLGLWARGGQGGSNYSYTTKNGTYYSEREWLVGLETMKRLDLENRLIENGDKLYRKLFVSETSGAVPETIWLNTSNTANASDELKAIFNTKNQFDTPKPVPLILQILKIGSQNNDLGAVYNWSNSLKKRKTAG